MKIILKICLLFCILNQKIPDVFGAPAECSSPPPMVDPHACCKDPGPNQIAKICAKKYGLPVAGEPIQPNLPPPSVNSTVCFADCVMTESKFLSNGIFNTNVMEAEIKKEFANDPLYTSVMIHAFKVCAASANQKFEAIKNMPMAQTILSARCSPMAGIILGCTYTEYFKNCPTNRWTAHPSCDAARSYVRNCVQ